MHECAQALTQRDYDELTGLLRDRAGVEIDQTRRFAIGARVSRRVRELGMTAPTQYLSFLQIGPHRGDELEELLRLATIGETSFGRYPRQLEVLEKSILPRLIEARRRERRRTASAAGSARSPDEDLTRSEPAPDGLTR